MVDALDATMMKKGSKLGRYQLLSLLGKGSMGRVYEAFDPNLARRVAIKVVGTADPEDPSGKAELQRRFVVEARAAGRLHHPGIVTVHDAAQLPAQNVVYMVMELVDGPSLLELVSKEGPLEPGLAIDLTAKIARALAYAHSQGVIHRDIKPANILLAPGDQPKIADFGIAKLATESHTRAGQILGSPKYMSPEQVLGTEVDQQTDLFSLAGVLYFCLTGADPFGSESLGTIVNRIMNEPPDLDLLKELPVAEGISELLLRALAKDKNERFSDGEAMATALLECLVDDGSKAGRSRSGDHKSAGGSTTRKSMAAFLLVSAAILTAVALVVVPKVQEQSAAPDAIIEKPAITVQPQVLAPRKKTLGSIPDIESVPQPPEEKSRSAQSATTTRKPSRPVSAKPEPTRKPEGLALLEVSFESRSREGHLTILVDGQTVLDEELTKAGSLVTFFGGVKRHWEIAVPAGQSTVTVKTVGANDGEGSAEIEGVFTTSESRTLRIRAKDGGKKVRLSWVEPKAN